MGARKWVRGRTFQIASSHLGNDIDNSLPIPGLPENEERVLTAIKKRPSFLMVGTLEPRKGHVQILDAFEHLWQNGIEANLVIVGKLGWLVDNLVERLQKHEEMGKHLFWLDGIRDEYLEKVYDSTSCLLAASYAEGFGLPLIEAVKHKLPIIARDIPVFREVCGMHAFYFNTSDPKKLSRTVEQWLDLYAQSKHPRSDGMPWLTWKQSAAQILEALEIQDQYKTIQEIT
jgi:glycosyltransferase involved in cell wall biosynthesis